MPTNAQLHDLLEALTHRVKAIEERMKTYEEQAKENNTILRDIEHIVKFARWAALAIFAALVSQAVGYLLHYIHP